jgi:hypothetical protein
MKVLRNDKGMIAVALKKEKNMIFTFRGCTDIDDVLYCVETGMTRPFLGKNAKFNTAIWNKYDELHEFISENMLDCEIGDKVVFTGHSLGGAIAQVAKYIHGGRCVSFGSPYVGDSEFVDSMGDDTLRVVIKEDIIPVVKFNKDLVHTKKKLVLKSMSREVFPNNIIDHHSSCNYLKCTRKHEVTTQKFDGKSLLDAR